MGVPGNPSTSTFLKKLLLLRTLVKLAGGAERFLASIPSPRPLAP